MVLGLDLDQTLVFNNLITETSKDLGYSFTHKDVRDWDFSTFPEEFRKELYKRFREKKYMIDNLTIINHVVDKLKEWKKKKYKLHIISARHYNLKPPTQKFVKKYFPMVDKLTIVDFEEPKKIYWKIHGIDVWIDDNPKECISACLMGLKTYMIQNEYTPYNFYVNKLPLNIIPVKSLKYIEL